MEESRRWCGLQHRQSALVLDCLRGQWRRLQRLGDGFSPASSSRLFGRVSGRNATLENQPEPQVRSWIGVL